MAWGPGDSEGGAVLTSLTPFSVVCYDFVALNFTVVAAWLALLRVIWGSALVRTIGTCAFLILALGLREASLILGTTGWAGQVLLLW